MEEHGTIHKYYAWNGSQPAVEITMLPEPAPLRAAASDVAQSGSSSPPSAQAEAVAASAGEEGAQQAQSSGLWRRNRWARRNKPGHELLSDNQVQEFIAKGYLVLPPRENEAEDGLGPAFHASVFERAQALGERAEQLGNNILPAMPELAKVFESQRVSGALKSLLGPGYFMHPHRFCHKSEPGRQAQTWHRDSYWGNWHPRSHVPYWIMALYFPQDTPIVLGPTGILPYSQYYNKDEGCRHSATRLFGVSRFSDADVAEGMPADVWQLRELPLACRAGTVVLIHYDIWHRGAANRSENGLRFMFKFQFSRTVSPVMAPRSWNFQSSKTDWSKFVQDSSDTSGEVSEAADLAVSTVLAQNGVANARQMPRKKLEGLATRALMDSQGSGDKKACLATVEQAVHQRLEAERAGAILKNLQPVWQGIWEWLCSAPLEDDVKNADVMWQHIEELNLGGDVHEPRRVAAAWKLGKCYLANGREELEFLADGFQKPFWSNPVKDRAVMQALEAAGSAALPTLLESSAVLRSPFAVRALGRALDSADHSGKSGDAALDLLGDICTDQRDVPMQFCAVEALGCLRHRKAAWFLLHVAKKPVDGDIRATACHGLLRQLQMGTLDAELEEIRDALLPLQDDNIHRYVAAYAAEGVHQVNHLLAQRCATEEKQHHIASSAPTLVRWCSFGDGWNVR
mmetsp:Transcript_2441/g.4824  ORF Transcript_2441/g.4824 Transcript_2441/m.4824 type:complete len:685 (+) Transcript_2441:73-2127(+)